MSSKAQAMVEFALVLPILMLIIIGVFEAGRLLFYYVAVNTASRDAARYGATVGTNGGVPHYYDCATMTQIAQSRGFIATISNVTIQYDHGPQANGVNPTAFGTCAAQPELVDGDRVVVTAEALFTPIVKELGGVRIFNDITVRSTSYRTIMMRTYLPQQVSYSSGSGSGGSGSSTSTSSSSSSSSAAKVLCQFTPEYYTNNAYVHNTAIINPAASGSGTYTITEIQIQNGSSPLFGSITAIKVNGVSTPFVTPSGVLPVIISGSWTLAPGQSLPVEITFNIKNQSKNFNLVMTKASGPLCERPLP
ncbi:MAG: TadE/TadG family type IV pilus assembly protein [Anaerolineales bacterium]